MDRQYIDDHHIIERYLDDQLPDDEREAFEAYYVTRPEIVQQIELAVRVKLGFAKLERDGALEPLLRPEKARSPSWLKLAAAATVAAVAIAVGVQFVGRTPATPLLARTVAELSVGSNAVLKASAPYTLVRRRDTNDATIELPGEPQALVLRLDLANVASSRSYQVTLRTPDGGEILTKLPGLLPDSGFVQVVLNSSAIAPGAYDLIVSASGQSEEDGVAYRVLFR